MKSAKYRRTVQLVNKVSRCTYCYGCLTGDDILMCYTQKTLVMVLLLVDQFQGMGSKEEKCDDDIVLTGPDIDAWRTGIDESYLGIDGFFGILQCALLSIQIKRGIVLSLLY